ncbi:MAG: hypothetical protein HYZ09_02120 [Candidatus Kerfeldbacteria bacterium]|nr:hypothetical protein [Candidatus Kerfeldbacteria bacterium]
MAMESGAKCFDCRRPFQPEAIIHYDHPWGWVVEGYRERQWLGFRCLAPRCGYETSFDKLGYRHLRPSELTPPSRP